jgi:hypothetical protein
MDPKPAARAILVMPPLFDEGDAVAVGGGIKVVGCDGASMGDARFLLMIMVVVKVDGEAPLAVVPALKVEIEVSLAQNLINTGVHMMTSRRTSGT